MGSQKEAGQGIDADGFCRAGCAAMVRVRYGPKKLSAKLTRVEGDTPEVIQLTRSRKADVTRACWKIRGFQKACMGSLCMCDRWAMHQQGIDDTIVSLAAFLKPEPVVVDASRVLSINGPRGPGKIIAFTLSRGIMASSLPASANNTGGRLLEDGPHRVCGNP